MDPKNKVAVITGGGRGIGKATALRLAQEGANVAILFREREKTANEVVKKIMQMGQKAKAYRVDVTEWDEVKKVFKEIEKDFGRIDILVNNAGVLLPYKPLEEIEIDEWNLVLQVNLRGAFYCSKAAIPIMKKTPGGVIINISSFASRMGGTLGTHYAASKAGINGLTISLSQELVPHGIRVNAVAPGPVETEVLLNLPKKKLDEIISRVSLKRLGKPEEVADAIAFLVRNEYINGEVIDINGGFCMD